MTTPRGAPEMAEGQNLKEETFNEGIRRTEAGANHFPVADRVTAPPGSCVDGAVYLIIATATGAFTGKENQLAVAVGTNAASGWYYRVLGTKDEGVTAWVQDEDAEYRWSGSAWATVGSGGGAPSIQSVTSSATVTPTFSNDQVNITAQAAGLTLANPTGTPVDGWGLAIRIKDNGTGRTISYGSEYRAIGVTLPTTTVASKTLYLGMIYNAADTKWDVVAVAQEA